MDTDRQPMEADNRLRRKPEGLSYKFQRLRERLRTAVTNGELSGKLPGERTLARRFHVNAKTLSKALTDLAAEGLLDRSIGRGTYVKGQAPIAHTGKGRWMIVAEADCCSSSLARLLGEANPESEVITDVTTLRPSFLKQFDAVIDLGQRTPETFLRDLAVRNIPLVAVNREPDVYSVNMVGTDRASGATFLTRDLVLGGHSRIAVVRSMPRSVVPRAVELAAVRYGGGAVRVCEKHEVVEVVRQGATAVVCDSTEVAREVKALLGEANLRMPEDVSLVAVGCCEDDQPCSGHYVDCRELAKSVADLLRDGQVAHRPTLLWMATRWVDRGTSRPLQRAATGETAHDGGWVAAVG
jgi:hypothetical protein